MSLGRNQPRLVVRYGKEKAERKDEAMIARFDHRPMLTAVLALSTAVLVVVVITLTTLLLTAVPPAATSSSQSGGNNPPAAAPAYIGAGGEFYGDGWNNYGWNNMDQPKPAQIGNGADLSAIDRHREMVAAYNK